jgi:hypothetical protein
MKKTAFESQKLVRQKYYLTHTPLLGMLYNFCFTNFSVKHMVWPGGVFQPQEASLWQDFFQTYMKTILGHEVPNFIETGQMVWISVADTHTLTFIY